MRDFHLNTHPDFIKISELCNWGEDHSDLWVRQLARIVSEINHAFPLKNGVQEALYQLEEEIHELTRDLEDAAIDQAEAESDRDRAFNERDALKLELDADEQNKVITDLKGRVYSQLSEIRNLHKNLDRQREEFDQLTQEHVELKEKYNTWRIIST